MTRWVKRLDPFGQRGTHGAHGAVTVLGVRFSLLPGSRTLALADAAASVLDSPRFDGEPGEVTADDMDAAALEGVNIPPSFYGLDAYGGDTAPAARVERRAAMQVPAVKRSRDLIAGPLGLLPLTLVGEPGKALPEMSATRLLEQPERDIPRSVTMTRTAEDLVLEGVAWWYITGFGWDGFPLEVIRLEPRTVDVLQDGRVHVTGDGHRGMSNRYPTDAQLIRFDSPNDPLLVAGARAIRTALRLDRAASNYADGAPPLGWFSPTENADPADDDEIVGILDAWAAARRRRSTGYVPASLKYNEAGYDPSKLQLNEARQHAVLEIARVAGIDPEQLGVSTTSRTYLNAFDVRKNFLDFTLGAYRAAIEDRLSMRDVTRRGYRVKFDLDDFLRSDPKTRYEAYEVGLRAGALTGPEIRESEDRAPLPTNPTPPPAPAAVDTPTKEEAA